MKRELEKTVRKLLLALVLLLCGTIGPGNIWAQAPATIVDGTEIGKYYKPIIETKTFIDNLVKKATEKRDSVALNCLLPIQTLAQGLIPGAVNAKAQAENGLSKNDLVAVSNGIGILAALRESSKNLFGQALTCLSTTGSQKNWKEDVVNLLKPMITFSEEELLNLPEPSVEPTPWLSIYR